MKVPEIENQIFVLVNKEKVQISIHIIIIQNIGSLLARKNILRSCLTFKRKLTSKK